MYICNPAARSNTVCSKLLRSCGAKFLILLRSRGRVQSPNEMTDSVEIRETDGSRIRFSGPVPRTPPVKDPRLGLSDSKA